MKNLQKYLRHSGFVRYLRNTSWLAGGQAIRMVIGLLVSLAIARHLGPDDFGLFSLILSVVALVGVGSTLGIESVAKREFVVRPEEGPQILGTCFVVSGVTAVVLFVCLLVGGITIVSDRFTLVLLSILGASILFYPSRFIDVWFQAQARGDLSVLSSVSVLICFAFIKMIALIAESPLLIFCIIYLLEFGAIAVVQCFFYLKHFGPIRRFSFSSARAKSLIAESWPLVFSAMAITVYTHIDQVMLGAYLGQEAVGEYAAASKISSIFNLFPVIIAASLFPAIVNAKTLGAEIYQKRLQYYFDLNGGLAYAVVLPMSFLAPWLIRFLYGPDYIGGGGVLAIQAWSALFVFSGVARNQFLIAESLLKFSLIATLLGAVLNVGINFWLIPRYGGIGAAVATVVSYSVSAYFSSLLLSRMRPVFMMQTKSLCLLFNPTRLVREILRIGSIK